MVKEPNDDFTGLGSAETWLISPSPSLRTHLRYQESSGLVAEDVYIDSQLDGTDFSSSQIRSHDELKNTLATGVQSFVSVPDDYRNLTGALSYALEDGTQCALHSHQFDLLDNTGNVVLNVGSMHGDDDLGEPPDANELYRYILSFYDGQPIAAPQELKEMLSIEGKAFEGEELQSFEHNLCRSGLLMKRKLTRAVTATPIAGPSDPFRNLYIGEAYYFPAGRQVGTTHFTTASWISRLINMHHRSLLVRDFVRANNIPHFSAVEHFRPLYAVRRAPPVCLSIAQKLGVLIKVF